MIRQSTLSTCLGSATFSKRHRKRRQIQSEAGKPSTNYQNFSALGSLMYMTPVVGLHDTGYVVVSVLHRHTNASGGKEKRAYLTSVASENFTRSQKITSSE
ncbi:hypothetical protein H5410_044182 [Solanum commersonii]|uniref:Uncharacterized protein n=1 Tax=Solanum commersonii TaxID=4109 RepID=A0A9J5X954_SOLCO|nr:hypothetical protein H5410_044182 [Solanum commersonii]